MYVHYAVHEADVLREVWQRFKNGRPGTGGSDWRVKGDQEQVWNNPETGHCTHQSFSKHGADSTGSRRHLHRTQPEVPRVAGTVTEKKIRLLFEQKLAGETNYFLYRTSLGTTQRHRSCCVRMARLCSAPSTSLCPASTPWSTKQWRTPWWPLSCMKTQGKKPWRPV